MDRRLTMSHENAFEMTLLMSIAGASTLLTFVSQDRIDEIIARRMFTIMNLLMAVVVSFQVDATHVSRYVLAVLGPMIVNAVLSAATRFMPRDETYVRKRSS